jgi:hypothetical protein
MLVAVFTMLYQADDSPPAIAPDGMFDHLPLEFRRTTYQEFVESPQSQILTHSMILLRLAPKKSSKPSPITVARYLVDGPHTCGEDSRGEPKLLSRSLFIIFCLPKIDAELPQNPNLSRSSIRWL